jgi:hypothetical protein
MPVPAPPPQQQQHQQQQDDTNTATEQDMKDGRFMAIVPDPSGWGSKFQCLLCEGYMNEPEVAIKHLKYKTHEKKSKWCVPGCYTFCSNDVNKLLKKMHKTRTILLTPEEVICHDWDGSTWVRNDFNDCPE